MFNALRDIRAAEEQEAALYDGLLSKVKQLWNKTRGLRSKDQLSVEFAGRVRGEAIDFRLEFYNKSGSFVLTVKRDEGLPGVSFLGGPVDWMVYNLSPKLEEAEVIGHRQDTGEQRIVTPKKDATAFWKEISSLQEAGIDYMRQIVMGGKSS